MHSNKNNQQEKIKMYDKKLKYKILSIFAAAVMTFTAITPVWAERRTWKQMLLGETSSDTSEEKMLHLKLQV